MHVLCLDCLNWNGNSSMLNISKDGDGLFLAGIVAGGGGTFGCKHL